MKGISKHFKYYFHLFSIILFLVFLINCDGFTPTTYTITATSGPGGSISPSGEVRVTEGESQEFTIIPDECHQVAEVLVDGISQGSITTYTFDNINQNATIQASFTSVKIYNVDTGDPYDTIQEAIDASHSGDTIIVCPGTYYENIVLDNKNITLRSTDPANLSVVSATIIDGGGSDSVVKIIDDASTLNGFTIRNGNSDQCGGIKIMFNSPTISNNNISFNRGKWGGGIEIYHGSPTIEKNIIKFNEVLEVGGGISMSYSSPIIIGNTIEYNETDGNGGGIRIFDSNPVIIDNSIMKNHAGGQGGGIYISGFSSPIIGGASTVDTGDFNIICGNAPDQVYPDDYSNNYLSDDCE
jgi:hypothetical protein